MSRVMITEMATSCIFAGVCIWLGVMGWANDANTLIAGAVFYALLYLMNHRTISYYYTRALRLWFRAPGKKKAKKVIVLARRYTTRCTIVVALGYLSLVLALPADLPDIVTIGLAWLLNSYAVLFSMIRFNSKALHVEGITDYV